jgi:hypothetical protein
LYCNVVVPPSRLVEPAGRPGGVVPPPLAGSVPAVKVNDSVGAWLAPAGFGYVIFVIRPKLSSVCTIRWAGSWSQPVRAPV